MSRFWRNLLSVLIGFLAAGFGGLIVLIFWPLLFPQPLHGSSRGEDAAPLAFLAFYAVFGAGGFLLFRRLTRKHIRDQGDVTVLFR